MVGCIDGIGGCDVEVVGGEVVEVGAVYDDSDQRANRGSKLLGEMVVGFVK